jgi:hypothetical protein
MTGKVFVARRDDPRVSKCDRERHSECWFVFEDEGLLDVFKTQREAEYFAGTWRLYRKVKRQIRRQVSKSLIKELTRRFGVEVLLIGSELEKRVKFPKLSRKRAKRFEEVCGSLHQLVTYELLWAIRDSGWEDEMEASLTGSKRESET